MEKTNPHLLLGVTGSIAAYRTPDISAAIRRAGFDLRTIMTNAAAEFVTETSIKCMSRGDVYNNTDKLSGVWQPTHINLADWADVALVAPATAATIGRLANGMADGLLCETFLALPSYVPKFIAPAMNGHMLEQPSIQRNLEQLDRDGYHIIHTRVGELACGYEGSGKMATSDTIVANILEICTCD